MSARTILPLLAALTIALTACLGIDTFFFAARAVGSYRFDEVDPELDGDLSAPHPSLVPADLREEGMLRSADGADIHWVFARHLGGRAHATIFFSHGNGPHLGRFWDRVEVMWQLGYQVLVYDYPGFGRSTGTPTEVGMYAAGQAALEMLAARADVDPARIVLYGHSLGGAPTYELGARAMRGELGEVRPAAIVTESAWCSMEAMIQDAAFLDVPRELLSHLRFDNCARLAELRGVPVMLLHGARDRVVPRRQLDLLLAAAAEPPEVHILEDATHVDVSVVGEPWTGAMPAPGMRLPAVRPSASYASWMTSLAPPE